MTWRQVQQKLRQEASALLSQGRVDLVIGYGQGSLQYGTTPLLLRQPADVERLVASPFISHNLSRYLTEVKGRVGVVAKGCDSRSIVSLIQDNRVKRQDVFILGVPCSGQVDMRKVEALSGHERDQIRGIELADGKAVIRLEGGEKEFPLAEVLYDSCRECELPTPKEYDVLLGEPVAAQPRANSGPDISVMTTDERWRFWQKEFSRCIRCYACRAVCPACSCKRCFVEENEPQWLLPVPAWQDNLFFQLTRQLHIAGRCSDCGACERACPMGIPLRRLAKGMTDIVDETFSFKAGMNTGDTPLLAAYEKEEAAGLIR